MKPRRFHPFYFFIALWIGMAIFQNWTTSAKTVELPYSEFMSKLRSGEVSEVVVGTDRISGQFKNATKDGRNSFITTRMEPELAEQLQASGVKFSRSADSSWFPMLLSWILPTLIFFGLWMLLAKRMQSNAPGGFMASLGKNKAKVYVEKDTKTSFSDVAGVDEAKEELEEVVGFLKAPGDYGRLGARVPKGVLLVGPPGTGKTLLARAVAGEARVPFFSISGSEFVEMFVGLGAARVRDLFEQARAKAPCIIFIDELDALGKSRNSPFATHDEKEQTLNQMLTEMDGFDAASGIVILAATNRPEILDPALLRAGRFDRQVLVDRPDRKGRLEILRIHSKPLKLAPEANLEQVADLTPGFTGADLANLCNEAAIIATRNKRESITQSDFTLGFERIVAGLERKNRLLNEKEKRIVAHHEMGHALVATSLPGADPVHKISVIPRGVGALGYTLQRPTGDRFLMTEQELRNRMCVLLGGRAAEMLMFNHFSTGAADDLVKATDIARNMVTRYGMDNHIGSVSVENDSPGFLGNEPIMLTKAKNYSEETSREIDSAVKHLIEEELDRAIRIIGQNREVLSEGAALLITKETLDSEELAELFARIEITDHERGSDTSADIVSVDSVPLRTRRALADLPRRDRYLNHPEYHS